MQFPKINSWVLNHGFNINKLVLLVAVTCALKVHSQNWTQKANFPGSNRYYATGFSIGHYGFIGCGSNSSGSYNDFYKWNQYTNIWTAIASYPGSGYRYSPIGFTIEGKGYVGLGWAGGHAAQDLWRYDTTTNTWSQMASLPGHGRYDEAVFVLGHKVWIITGSQGGSPYLNDIWMYDAHTNTWTQKNNSPGGKLSGMAAFTIAGRGYIGGGWDGNIEHSQFWQYDSSTDSWTPIPDIPYSGGCSGDTRGFVLGDTGYVCTGTTNTYQTLPIGYAYHPSTNSWSEFSNMGANRIERGYSVAFTIGSYGYIGTGRDSNNSYLNTYWEYPHHNCSLTSARIFSSKTTICSGDTLTLTANASGSNSVVYSWNPGGQSSQTIHVGPGVTTTYTVAIYDTIGLCFKTATFMVNVNPSPSVTISGNMNICLGDSTTLTASGGTIYSWGNGDSTSALKLKPAKDTTLSLSISNGLCTTDTTFTVTARTKPVPHLSGQNVICFGNEAQINASGGTSYSWQPSVSLNASNIANPIATPSTTTVYTVTVFNGGCPALDSFLVIVNPVRVVNACCNTSIILGQSTQLNSSGGATYAWNPTNGLNCANCPDPVATPSTTTTYTLTVTSDSGCNSSTTITIDITCGQVFVADAFSPNGDGHNDCLHIHGVCIQSMVFEVFDRWGNKIYETQNLDDCWDGKRNGQPMNADTYIYYLKAEMIDGSHVERKGNVTLVR